MGLTVSELGLGLAALGRPGYITLGHGADLAGRTQPASLEHQAHRVLDAARAAGITYVDAARSYGRAEEFLADWLRDRGVAPGELAVGSKWGYVYSADWRVDAEVHEVKIHSVQNLDRQHDESTSLLGRYLRVYQIHSATEQSGVLRDAAVLERLAALRDDGMVVGFSTSGPDQARTIREAVSIEVAGRPLFGSVQATWNLLERSAGAALHEAHEAGLAVIVKEALANGRLAGRDPATRDLAREAGGTWSVDALAIAAALHQPWASVVLSGAVTPSQLASNLAALDVPPDVVDRLPALDEPSAHYWATRGALPWT